MPRCAVQMPQRKTLCSSCSAAAALTHGAAVQGRWLSIRRSCALLGLQRFRCRTRTLVTTVLIGLHAMQVALNRMTVYYRNVEK